MQTIRPTPGGQNRFNVSREQGRSAGLPYARRDRFLEGSCNRDISNSTGGNLDGAATIAVLLIFSASIELSVTH